MATSSGLSRFKKAFNEKKVVPVVGAGVSMSAASMPSWIRMVESGIDFAEECGGSSPEDITNARELLRNNQVISAAEKVKSLLRAPGGGQYRSWLEQAFIIAEKQITAPEVPYEVANLMCPIVATTNYDNLLEQILLGYHESIAWTDPHGMLRALSEGNAVLHLHGIFSEPASIVLGTQDYDRLVENAAYRDVLRTLWLEKTLLFIGCSFDGLQDPDFFRMLEWFSKTFPESAHRHYAFMKDGSYSVEQQADWLHRLRVQVIPYGPTHEDLAAAIQALNSRHEQAVARRSQLAKRLIPNLEPTNLFTLNNLLQGMKLGGPDPSLHNAAEALVDAHNRRDEKMKHNMLAMQRLCKELVDPKMITDQIYNWKKNVRFEGEFRKTVISAASALNLFEHNLLKTLKRRGVNIHGNVINGTCEKMLELLENGQDPTFVFFRQAYMIENMQRILSSLNAIFRADMETLFSGLSRGQSIQEPIKDCLLIVRHDGVELLSLYGANQRLAYLPLSVRAGEGSFEKFRNDNVVVFYTHESVFVWDPKFEVPLEEFAVEDALGISGAAHQYHNGVLESVVATYSGVVYQLSDMQRTKAWRPIPRKFLSDMLMFADLRVFGLPDFTDWFIVELSKGQCLWRLSAAQLAEQLLNIALFKNHHIKRIREEKEWYKDLIKDEASELREINAAELSKRFQSPKLGEVTIDNEQFITLQVKLSYHTHDEVILLINTSNETFKIAGYFLVPNQLVGDFFIYTQSSGELSIVCALLEDSDKDYDVIRAKAVDTNLGKIFVQEATLAITNSDFVNILSVEDNLCFAADDTGVLYRFSFQSREWKKVENEASSRINKLEYFKLDHKKTDPTQTP